MARSTLYDIKNGTTWPDILSISQLEAVLEVPLWPRWDVGQTAQK